MEFKKHSSPSVRHLYFKFLRFFYSKRFVFKKIFHLKEIEYCAFYDDNLQIKLEQIRFLSLLNNEICGVFLLEHSLEVIKRLHIHLQKNMFMRQNVS